MDYYELTIQSLRLWVSLGCSPEERSNPQPVDIGIKMTFSKEPLGCKSDQLDDVICYQTVVDEVTKIVQVQSFHLIECLARTVFDIVANYLHQKRQSEIVLEIAIAKTHHPVVNVHEPVIFTYRRRLPQKSLSP